jgi:Cu(I)/Ag(I) efflux system membrane protein CusA/SilA
MIERIIELSIRHRSLVIIASLAVAISGAYALLHTPVDAIPDLSENQVIVFTEWPGHSPREIEDQLTYPLSLNLRGLEGVTVVRSSSDFNFSSISLIFQDSVGFYEARSRVAERLARLGDLLPSGLTPQLAPESLATGQIFWYTVEGHSLDLGRLRAIQDWYVRPQLASVPGVAEVASVGGYPIEFQIEVDPDKLLIHQVTLPEVVHAVSRSNSAAAGYVVQQANAEFIVRGVAWLGMDEHQAGAFDPRSAIRDLEKVVVGSGPRAATAMSGDGVDMSRHEPNAPSGNVIVVSDVATVSLGGQPRRGVLEKDGNEVAGGVVLMRYGENPLRVTERIKEKIAQLEPGLPHGVRIVPGYDRTPLIKGAMSTVTRTLVEAILTASVCVLLVMRHVRTSLIIAVTLPLATLASFLVLAILRHSGITDVQTNIMSLAGITISIGVLVDSSIVMAENVMHSLKSHFGDRPVRGDVRPIVLAACQTVGRPIFFSVAIMLMSFIPVFALGGMEGKMFRPLAVTKLLALFAVAVLAITLVPALCTIFVRGRLRGENESWIVRSFSEVYRPALNFLLDRPAVLVWIMSLTLILGLAPIGNRVLSLGTLFAGMVLCGLTTRSGTGRVVSLLSLVILALLADQRIEPLGREFISALDEGTVMDMPITVPRASVTQSADDLKARDMVLCRFPEVEMVMGKAGRAETATDPAPMDMIETMVEFRPTELWPRRRLSTNDAERHARHALDELVRRNLIDPVPDAAQLEAIANESARDAVSGFDQVMREVAYLKNQEFIRELGHTLVRYAVQETIDRLHRGGQLRRSPSPADIATIAGRVSVQAYPHLGMVPALQDVTAIAHETIRELVRIELVGADFDLSAGGAGAINTLGHMLAWIGETPPATAFSDLHQSVVARHRALWRGHVRQLNLDLLDRAPAVYTRLVTDQLLQRTTVRDAGLARRLAEEKNARSRPAATAAAPGGHHGSARALPAVDPYPPLDTLRRELAEQIRRGLLLWSHDRYTLAGFGSEMDRELQMPGWTNVWTMPIQNRVDMLATGVNTAIGVRVLGGDQDQVVGASEKIATALRRVPGAADVVADPIRGKGYLEVRPDRDKLARYGVAAADVTDAVESAIGGKVVTSIVAGRERYGVRVRYARDRRTSEQAVKDVLVVAHDSSAANQNVSDHAADIASPTLRQMPLEQVAEVRTSEGPATIKSENGLLRNYVRLNVRGRGVVDFVEEAKRVVAEQVDLPEGIFVEWTGQFEHQMRARNTLLVVMPAVIVLIFLVLYLTYHDLADAILMMLAVPGAIAGGVLFQWFFGYKFSVTVWIGYIACFGMATATGIIMLVYLREAVQKAGGLQNMDLTQLREAVLEGAVQRLRPKLLTEATTIIGLAPMLWASGAGAEVIKPMATPVLGGILIADEVIDLFIPVLFYWVRRWRWHRLHSSIVSSESLAATPVIELPARDVRRPRPVGDRWELGTAATEKGVS